VAALVTRRLCLLGFGNVGRRFCELVARSSDELAHAHGLRVAFTAVGTGSHGSLLARGDLTAAEVLAAAGTSPAGGFPAPVRPGVELVAASGADLLVEATPLDPHGGAAAIAHLEAGLTHDMDAITVNKGPIAWDYRRLAELAAARGRRLMFEGAVMDGCPVFSLFRSCLPDCRLLGFDAVFNSTTNYILDAMGEGVGFAAALAQVQAAGYAEADPAHDIDGHDAAAKTVVLANVLMGASLTPDDVPKDGIGGVSAARVAAARAAGRRLRVVCSARRGAADGAFDDAASGAIEGGDPDGRVRAAVRLTELAPEHPLFAAGGSTLSVLLHTDLMGTLQIAEHGALPEQTAYAIYADLLAVHEGR
jgi:homoserine dehydrogenase